MISWSFIRGVLATVLFVFNLNTSRIELGTLAIIAMIVLGGIECAQSRRIGFSS